MDNSKQTFQGIFVLSLPPGPDFCVFCCNLPRLRASAVFLTERQELSIFELHRRRVSSQNQKSSANMNLSSLDSLVLVFAFDDIAQGCKYSLITSQATGVGDDERVIVGSSQYLLISRVLQWRAYQSVQCGDPQDGHRTACFRVPPA